MTIQIRSMTRMVPHTRSVFPGGEVHVRINPTDIGGAVPYTILAFIKNSNDVMELLMVTDALRRQGIDRIILCMPYIPYARQDRVCNGGEALSIKVFADIINSQNYEEVQVEDAHSDVAPALLHRCTNLPSSGIFRYWIPIRMQSILHDPLTLVAPDAGAIKKVARMAAEMGVPFVRADKTRDTKTGDIVGTTVYSPHIGDASFLIVDDICDGGRTFIELAQVLRPLTNGKIYLYVTHGIFSRGPKVFDGIIDRIFVANSFLEDLPPNFTVFGNLK